MKLIFLFLYLICFTVQPANRGDLTIVIRDTEGARISVTVTIYKDEDDFSRTKIGSYITQNGEVTLKDLQWGLYIVQFEGETPLGRMQPASEQNQAMLDDGRGVNGFGVRFAEPTRREMFVIKTENGEAIPLFDLESDPNRAPRPFEPQENTIPTIDQTEKEQPTNEMFAVGILLFVCIVLCSIIGIGFLKSRKAKKQGGDGI